MPIKGRRTFWGGGGFLGGAGFSPSDISGIMFWYDFSAISGLSDSDSITTLSDLSGNSHTLTGDATKQPIWKANILNGLGGGLWDAVNDCLYTASFAWGSNEGAVFAVVSAIPTGTDRMIAEFSPNAASNNGAWFVARLTTNLMQNLIRNNNVSSSCPSTTSILTSAFLVGMTFDQDNTDRVQCWVNGSQEGAHTNNNNGTANLGTYALYIGSRNNGASVPLGAYIHEIVGYNVELTTGQVALLTAYFNNRWGL